MAFASGSLEQLRYIPEATRGVTPATGNSVNLRMTEATLKASVKTIKSAEVNPRRIVSGNTRVDLDVDGGFNFELSSGEYDPFIEGLLGSTFVGYGTAGFGATFTASNTATTITAAAAPTGSSAFTGLATGQWFKLVPPTSSTSAQKLYFADLWLKVLSTTATSITLDASTPISTVGQVTAATGFAVSSSLLVNGTTRKTFSIEQNMTDTTSFLLYSGMEANTLDIKVDVGSAITGSFGFIGQGHQAQDGTSFLPGTPVASKAFDTMSAVTDVGTVYENGINLLAGTSFIKGMTLNVNNNARGQKAVGVFGNAGVGLGELAISGNIEVYFQNTSMYLKWLNGTRTSLSIGIADSAGNGYLFDFTKVLFRDGALKSGGNNADVMLTLPFDAFYDSVAGRGMTITRATAQ